MNNTENHFITKFILTHYINRIDISNEMVKVTSKAVAISSKKTAGTYLLLKRIYQKKGADDEI